MNRSDWLLQTRHELEKLYDADAPLYGEKWGTYPNETQLEFIQKLLNLLPPESVILDAACGAGRYIAMFLEQGHRIMGIDQAGGMLSQAQTKFPAIEAKKVGLQEMDFAEAFDGAICVDAMEHIFPEDWTRILSNFHRALKSQGHFYFTVELADPNDVEAAFAKSKEQNLPLVFGEWMNDDCYHFYPPIQQVRDWLKQTNFDLIEDGEGDGYHHFLVRKP